MKYLNERSCEKNVKLGVDGIAKNAHYSAGTNRTGLRPSSAYPDRHKKP